MEELTKKHRRVLFLILFGVIDVFLLIATIVSYVKEIKNIQNSFSMKAVVKENVKKEYATSSSYISVYTYSLDNKIYKGITSKGNDFPFSVGDTVSIVVNEYDHEQSRLNDHLDTFRNTYGLGLFVCYSFSFFCLN